MRPGRPAARRAASARLRSRTPPGPRPRPAPSLRRSGSAPRPPARSAPGRAGRRRSLRRPGSGRGALPGRPGRFPPRVVVHARADLRVAAVVVPRRLRRPLERLVEIAYVEDDEAAELLLGLDERPVGHLAVTTADPDRRRGVRALQALAGDQHAGLARG